MPIGLVCFLIWFYFLRLNYKLKTALAVPSGLEDEIQEKLARGEEWGRIKEFVCGLNNLVSNIIIYMVEKADRGANPLAVFKETCQGEYFSLEKDLVVLKALVTSAPFLGLLGTVLGMINTFEAIALKSAGTAGLMASGISQALITTQFGLVVALGGIFGISLLKRRIRQLEVRFSMLELHITLGLRKRSLKGNG